MLSATAFALGVLWRRTGEGFVAYDFYGQFYPWVEHARRGLATGGALSSFLGRLGQRTSEKLPPGAIRVFNILFATLAGATVFGLIGLLIEWLYQIGRPMVVLWGPMIAGGLLGGLLALITKPKDTLSTGMVIYYVTRTFLNGLRSIEALVMAIVFVIAVVSSFLQNWVPLE